MSDSQNMHTLDSLIADADAVIEKLETFRAKALTWKSELAKAQNPLTPEEEFRREFPNLDVEPEFFKLVGCMGDISSVRSDKELIIDAIKAKYESKDESSS